MFPSHALRPPESRRIRSRTTSQGIAESGFASRSARRRSSSSANSGETGNVSSEESSTMPSQRSSTSRSRSATESLRSSSILLPGFAMARILFPILLCNEPRRYHCRSSVTLALQLLRPVVRRFGFDPTVAGRGLLERLAWRFAAGDLEAATSMSNRSARFTDFASGNASATSGSRRTRLVPAAARRKYFPVTPRPSASKSYSERSSSVGFALLILLSLARCGPSCADDSKAPEALRVGNEQYSATRRVADRDLSVFGSRMVWVRKGAGAGIQEDGGRLLESNAVLLEISDGFLRIPLERHDRILASHSSSAERGCRKTPDGNSFRILWSRIISFCPPIVDLGRFYAVTSPTAHRRRRRIE